jgi:hypothetical protein
VGQSLLGCLLSAVAFKDDLQLLRLRRSATRFLIRNCPSLSPSVQCDVRFTRKRTFVSASQAAWWVFAPSGQTYWTEAMARPVSNAVARAYILRCLEVVADQAAGQKKDVEAELWVQVSAV